jgi:hypothetical protein
MSAETAPDRQSFGRVSMTLAVYVVLGPILGAAFALLLILPTAMVAFGPSMAAALWGLVVSNPWLPYSYGLLPAALTGIVIVVREARSGPVSLRFLVIAGAVVGFAAALVSGGHFPSTNPYQIGLFTVSSLVSALGCGLVLRLMRRIWP